MPAQLQGQSIRSGQTRRPVVLMMISGQSQQPLDIGKPSLQPADVESVQ
jgi:hypothetical protein